MDPSRVRGERGRGGSTGEDIVDNRKAYELIDGSSKHSIFINFNYFFFILILIFWFFLLKSVFDVAYVMLCIQSSYFRFPQLGFRSLFYSSPSPHIYSPCTRHHFAWNAPCPSPSLRLWLGAFHKHACF